MRKRQNPFLKVWAERLGRSLLRPILVAVFSIIPVVRDSELRLTGTFFLFRLARPPAQPCVVGLIVIDEESLRQSGRWPCSRALLGKLVKRIADRGAGVIGLDVLLSRPPSPPTDAARQNALQTSARAVPAGKRLPLRAFPLRSAC
jgi:CHASE2 domain-containing sensor protein